MGDAYLADAQASNLTNEKAQSLLLQATRGYIGVLNQILCESATRTLQMGKERITLATLRQVVKSVRSPSSDASISTSVSSPLSSNLFYSALAISSAAILAGELWTFLRSISPCQLSQQ